MSAPPVASGFVAGCMALQQCASLPPRLLVWTALAVLLPCALVLGRRPWVRWLVALGLGGCWAAWQAHMALAQRIPPSAEGRDWVVIGIVDELPLDSPQGIRFGFRITACAEPDPACPINGRIRLGWSSSFSRASHSSDEASPPIAVAPGEVWQFNVRLKRPAATVNFGLFDAELRMLEEGIVAIGYVRKARAGDLPNERLPGWHVSLRTLIEAARAAGLSALEHALREQRADAAAVLLALAFGNQAAIAGADWEVFNRTGVAHLMSISGLHITMLAAIAAWGARRLLSRRWVARSGLLTRMPAVTLQWCFAIAVALAYSGLAGWGIPAQRTCWMLTVAGWAIVTGRSRAIVRVL